jgi:hypothetical protein
MGRTGTWLPASGRSAIGHAATAQRASDNTLMKWTQKRQALMIRRIAATGAMTNCTSVSLRGCSLRLDDTQFIGGSNGKRAV